MNWLSLDTVVKVLLPIATFGLGIAVTLLTKHIEKRKAELREHVNAICGLAANWYAQLHELSNVVELNTLDIKLQQAIIAYASSRTVLPHYQMHLEFLRERKADRRFLNIAEEFFELVAIKLPRRRVCSDFNFSLLQTNPDRLRVELTDLIIKVDAKLQELNVVSAHVLEKKS